MVLAHPSEAGGQPKWRQGKGRKGGKLTKEPPGQGLCTSLEQASASPLVQCLLTWEFPIRASKHSVLSDTGAPLGFMNLVTFPRLEPYQHVFFPLPTHTGSPSASSQIPLCSRPMGSRTASHNLWPGGWRCRAMVSALCTTHQSPGHLQPALALASLQSCSIKYSQSMYLLSGVLSIYLACLQTHTALFLCTCSQLQDPATTEPAMIQLLAGWGRTHPWGVSHREASCQAATHVQASKLILKMRFKNY